MDCLDYLQLRCLDPRRGIWSQKTLVDQVAKRGNEAPGRSWAFGNHCFEEVRDAKEGVSIRYTSSIFVTTKQVLDLSKNWICENHLVYLFTASWAAWLRNKASRLFFYNIPCPVYMNCTLQAEPPFAFLNEEEKWRFCLDHVKPLMSTQPKRQDYSILFFLLKLFFFFECEHLFTVKPMVIIIV